MSKKYEINLLQPELLPKSPLLTLSRVIKLWIVVFVISIGAGIYGQLQLTNIQNQNKLLNVDKSRKLVLQEELTAKVASHRTDPLLNAQLETLKTLIANKKILYTNLTDRSKTYVAGFAQAMSELAKIHHKDISLQHISISHDNISFTGIARTPNAVPTWMAEFKNAYLLSGKLFKHFELSESKQGYTKFFVSSNQPAQERQ